MKHLSLLAVASVSIVLTGCGSAYKGITDSSGLGSGQYIPAVYVKPGAEEKYAQVLGVCRQVAQNRQMTAAQEAQLKTITGAVEGTAAGAAAGAEIGSIFSQAGFSDASTTDAALIGAAAGVVSSVASAFASGAESTAEETKKVLLTCLDRTGQGGELWEVLETF